MVSKLELSKTAAEDIDRLLDDPLCKLGSHVVFHRQSQIGKFVLRILHKRMGALRALDGSLGAAVGQKLPVVMA